MSWSPTVELAASERGTGPAAGCVERWLEAHMEGMAIAIVVAGFVARIPAASPTHLNPDEALHRIIFTEKLWAGLLLAAALMGESHTTAKIAEAGMTPENDRLPSMTEAVRHMEATILPGCPIVVEYLGSLPLAYYLCGRPYFARHVPVRIFSLSMRRVFRRFVG